MVQITIIVILNRVVLVSEGGWVWESDWQNSAHIKNSRGSLFRPTGVRRGRREVGPPNTPGVPKPEMKHES